MKRLLSLIIALSMIISASAVFAADEAVEEAAPYVYDVKAYEDARNLMLSIVGEEIFGTDPAAEVTRAQFVAATCAVFNIPAVEAGQIYADVKTDNPYAGFIAAANSAGIIADADNFSPDDTVTLAQAAKIMLTAADYNVMADAKGGYPAGYLTVANNIDLFDYIDTTDGDAVTTSDASIMFYNLMLAPVFDVVSYGDLMDYAQGKTNYLHKLYEAYTIEGIVTATEYSSLLYNAPLMIDNDTIAIDGVEYKYPEAGSELLGKRVIAYVDGKNEMLSGTKTILCILEDERNEELEILAKDYLSTNGTQLLYDKNGKQTRARLDSAYKVIYNGRRVSDNIMPTMLYDDFATIRLLNADGDGAYEVIFIDAYTYLRVANVDYINGYVSFDDNTGRQSYVVNDYRGQEDADIRKVSNKFIDLSTSTDVVCKVYNELGEEVELFEVTNNVIVGLKSSADHLVHEIVMCSQKPISGTVEIYDSENGILTLDGVEYYMSKDFMRLNFVNNQLIKIGDKITAYVGLNGELVHLSATESEYVYGVITAVKIEPGMDKTLKMEILTADGLKAFEGAEKMSYDSQPKTTNTGIGSEIYQNLCNAVAGVDSNGKEIDSVIKYAVNKKGQIVHIDFPVDESANASYDPTNHMPAYDSFTKVFNNKSGNYRPGVSGLVSTVVLSDAKIVVDLGSNEKKEDRYFYTSASGFENNYQYTMDIYDVDENGYSKFAYVTGGPTDSSRSTTLKTYIIEKSVRGIADEYDGYILTCYGNGMYETYFLPDENIPEGKGKDNAGNEINGKRAPKAGDLIRFTIEKDNIIDEYYTDFYCEALTTILDGNSNPVKMYQKIIGCGSAGQYVNNGKTSALPANILFANVGYSDSQMRDLTGSSAAGYVTGYVYNSEKTMVLCNGKDGDGYSFADFRPYLLPNTVVLFDTQARKVTVTPYMPSAVKTYKANPGEEDFVVLRCNAGKPEIAFVYR